METHVSLFDRSNCGIKHRYRDIFSVQYHPEASPGPHDSVHLFSKFFQMAIKYKLNRKKMSSNNIIISGLGISGLITASLFCKEKIEVHCFEPSDFLSFLKIKGRPLFLTQQLTLLKK